VEALEEALQRVSGLIHEAPELVEMDLNPVMVLEPGKGICVVDARMRVVPIDAAHSPTIRDLPGVTSSPAV
jgi:acyl-CoA synthetase (NDP forming)